MEFIKDWIIPLVSLALSIWFAASAKKDADSAQTALNSINKAIDEWQRQLMASTINILDSTPQVIEGKKALAKLEAARELILSLRSAIEASVKDPQPGAAGHTQTENLKVTVDQIDRLLKSMSEAK
jgi:hypothetical protein